MVLYKQIYIVIKNLAHICSFKTNMARQNGYMPPISLYYVFIHVKTCIATANKKFLFIVKMLLLVCLEHFDNYFDDSYTFQ